MSRNGRPEPDVIHHFIDGCAYSKNKMESAVRNLGLVEPIAKSLPSTKYKETGIGRKEHVDAAVVELEISRAEVEQALANEGNIVKALAILANA